MGLEAGAHWAPYLHNGGALVGLILVLAVIAIPACIKATKSARVRGYVLMAFLVLFLTGAGVAVFEVRQDAKPSQTAVAPQLPPSSNAVPKATSQTTQTVVQPVNSPVMSVGGVTVEGVQESNVQIVNGHDNVVTNNTDNQHAH
jgi:hypothetical protein